MLGNLIENESRLKRIFIEPKLPVELAPLADMANNLWWSWQHEGVALFEGIDKEKFAASNHNPVALLEALTMEEAGELVGNKAFMARMNRVYDRFKAYMQEKPVAEQPEIAYFCMEYGLHISIRLYSGGLGILAGDYLKEASDRNARLTAVGLLYRYGYFQQGLSLHGDQIHHLEPAKFTQLPYRPVRKPDGEWLRISVEMGEKTIWAKVWELRVGRISLYLLDADIEDNHWDDRAITHQLYGGDNEMRIRQEVLLGIGGARLIKALQLHPDVYHLNEGHAAFLGLERLCRYHKEQAMPLEEAMEVVRATQLFTTHTPVPAGHDAFSDNLMRKYMQVFADRLNLSWEKFMALGRVDSEDHEEIFSMSHLAIRTCQEVNGVSRLHGEVSQKMFNVLYPDYSYAELNLGYVTNCIHYPTWIAPEWDELYKETFGKSFFIDQTNHKVWSKIHDVPAEKIMSTRALLKKRLLDWVRASLREELMKRGEGPRTIFETVNAIREDALVIGFARRFATYKRATLLLTNERRLADILGNANQPVLFLFAGKAHPADKGGQDLIRQLYITAQKPEFKGKIIFLENYNMEMAKLMVQGVDIWLNNPTRPKEASGTSGMKAVINGVMNFSVLDGWWCEGYRPGAGWALPETETYADTVLQNELDAETIYNILESDIIPTYFYRDSEGVPSKWVSHIKHTIADIAPDFVMKRMLDDYKERFYQKLWKRGASLKSKGFELTRTLVDWKGSVRRGWEHIEVIEMRAPDTYNRSLPLGERFEAAVTLQLHHIKPEDIGVEVVFYRRKVETELELVLRQELLLKHVHGTIATFHCDFKPHAAGVFEYGFRMFPKHPMLPHRQDFELVRWL